MHSLLFSLSLVLRLMASAEAYDPPPGFVDVKVSAQTAPIEKSMTSKRELWLFDFPSNVRHAEFFCVNQPNEPNYCDAPRALSLSFF